MKVLRVLGGFALIMLVFLGGCGKIPGADVRAAQEALKAAGMVASVPVEILAAACGENPSCAGKCGEAFIACAKTKYPQGGEILLKDCPEFAKTFNNILPSEDRMRQFFLDRLTKVASGEKVVEQ
jgi:hypothetical protein